MKFLSPGKRRCELTTRLGMAEQKTGLMPEQRKKNWCKNGGVSENSRRL
jgi:hypothetical protein